MHRSHARVLVIVVASAFAASWADAREGCCCRCGCPSECQKVCRLVCEEKTVDVVCWGCKCEYFCLPGPSTPHGEHCEMICGECDASGDCTRPHAKAKRFVWTDWVPGCAKIHVRKKLMQKTVAKKVPSYKWVVEDLCPACCESTTAAEVEPDVAVPAPPAGFERLDYQLAVQEAAASSAKPAPQPGAP
jgi:hypothetical protein